LSALALIKSKCRVGSVTHSRIATGIKNMNWLVQDTPFLGDAQQAEFLKELAYADQTVIPLDRLWSATIDLKLRSVDNKPIIPIGSQNLTWFGINEWYGLDPWAIFSKSDHPTYDRMRMGYGSHFLNEDAGLCTIRDLIILKTAWIRQNAHFNIIKGQVIEPNEWPALAMNHLRQRWYRYDTLGDALTIDSVVAYASVKTILAEYRLFVVKGQVVTGSQYRRDGQDHFANIDNQRHLIKFGQNMVDLWSPSETFVLDICVDEFGILKVLETNCLNCSGQYMIDGGKLIEAIVKAYDS